ncbi:SusC/RagA family TonB-linked outer membrane protein [Maribellus sediminis]|uniref:SusC/RagA family TonB-linked outer membrane protein n=1 Tax=Maribellus sediminis TaxID=2696285 RepID=UPI001431CA63|nr:SusC/RagA family TonB-linked outer membrane protein [Maribellus sediminis]
MRRTLFFVALLILNLSVFAQTSITGRVTDDASGDPVPGASVVVEGTTVGTVTGPDGAYTIQVSTGTDIIVFSFLGYKTEKVTVGSQTEINVSLKEDIEQLEEVVVTAMGIKREKRALGYGAQDVGGDEVAAANPTNVVSALSGKVAGVSILTSSGQVGASSSVVIRGIKSIQGSNQALFVVDGTPIMNTINSAMSSSTYTDFGNAAMDIDPSEIESVSVLRGASASALYGSRAANGVILITTKKGSQNKGLGVELSSSVAFDNVYLLPNYQNEYGQGRNGSEYEWQKNYSDLTYQEFHDLREFRWGLDGSGYRMDWDESWGSRLDAGLMVAQMDSPLDENGNVIPTPWVSQPDNVKDYYETGISTVNNIALSASNEKANGRLTLGHKTQKGTAPNTDMRQINIGIKSEFKLTDRLSFDVNVTYTDLQNDNLPQQGNSMRNPLLEFNSWFGRQVNTQYLKEHYDDIIIYNGKPTAFNWMMDYDSQHPNPYWNAYKNTMSRERNRVFGNAAITWNVAKGIDLIGRVGTDFFNEHRKFKYHQYSRDWTDMYEFSTNGNFWEQYRIEKETNADLLLEITKAVGDFDILATVGGNYRQAFDRFATTSGSNLIVPDFFSTSNFEGEPTVSFTEYKKVTNSVFASANIGFKRYLYLDMTVRGDWSSTLPSNNWNYWYPSANLSFIVTDALGLESSWLNYAKIRGGYAVVGNDTGPYNLSPVFYSIGTTFNGVNLFGAQSTLPSYNLKPELTNSFEVGGEMKFFNNRLGLDLTYYNATTKNQLLSVDIPVSSGYSSWMKNAGEILNKGFEVQLYGTPVKTRDFSWDVVLNWATNTGEVVELADGLTELQLAYYYSYGDVSLMAFPGEPIGDLYGTTFARNDNGDILVDRNGMPLTSTDSEILGNINPDYFGGIRNTFTYKGFSLTALIDYRVGGDVFSMTKSVGQKAGILQSTVEGGIRETGMIAEGVYEDGTMLDLNNDGTAEDVSGQPNQSVISARDYWRNSRDWAELAIVDGSYVKLREVVLAYRFPKKIVNSIRLQDLTMSVYGRNLALLYTHESNDVNIDPEVASGSTLAGAGLEAYQLPPSRTIGFKLNVKF